MKYCHACGFGNTMDAKFCASCGAKLAKTSKKKQAATQPTVTASPVAGDLNYFGKLFHGRIGVGDYWLGSIVYLALFFGLLTILGDESSLSGLVILAYYFHHIALTVRRAHDHNDNGWTLFLFLVPLVNIYYGIKFAFITGTRGPNNYGPENVQRETLGERVKRILCV